MTTTTMVRLNVTPPTTISVSPPLSSRTVPPPTTVSVSVSSAFAVASVGVPQVAS
jgi:hypothetical protein